jgi:phage virion morphogenesis protein
MFTVQIKEDEITGALDSLLLHLGDMTPVMQEIGELLIASTRARLNEGISPDGAKWAAKSPNTKGRDRRPLRGPTGDLFDQISTKFGSDHVEIGSSMVYAGMMQFGGTKAQFPHLWGDIPARPFLGVSEEDRSGILATVEEWLDASARAGAADRAFGD